MPASSTIGEVLRRRGLTTSKMRRPRGTNAARAPFADVTGPNATWCVDFKGHFRMGNGQKCYPLTLIDAHSRYLLRCEGVLEPDGREVQRIFDSAFQEYGLPATIRSDNGPPFATVGAGGRSKLSVWWIKLGVRVERIAPGRPQENGRQERFHRTLKAETATPPNKDLCAQQRVFDSFRREYNFERPHEALDQCPPASAYVASPRRYPRPLLRFALNPWDQPMRVAKDGSITWEGKRIFLTAALAYEDVELRYDEAESGERLWDVVFGPLSIGVLRETSRGTRFLPSRGWMKDIRAVSGMSSD